ncbi:MAG: elongation factor P maturation arginine rhamnosyltransferase EarP [Lautropia sp.]|nr:elongation factor P maturation arginine rhamnosyltransferase EarP [Lautropia sp.]
MKTLVIDTNIWLDLLVFDDPRAHPLRDGLADGRYRAIGTDAMRDELAAVLVRPQFRLDAQQQARALQRWDTLVQRREVPPACNLSCSDPDDRKFLDLAVAHRADWLLSKDRALLAARRFAQRRFGLAIGRLEQMLTQERVPAPDNAPLPASGPRWHLLCRVIDNFGDVGVLWRLARQLHDEHGLLIDFFIDQPEALTGMAPSARPGHAHAGIHLHRLDEAAPVGKGAAVVVAGFQARLPEQARAALRQQVQPPLLVQLDYLSAEDWIDSCHRLPSLHPDGLREHFFCPGFSPASGGLLLERDLLAQRDAFQADPDTARQWLAAHGVHVRPGEQLVSVLAYPAAPLPALVAGWLACPGTPPLHLLLPGAGIRSPMGAGQPGATCTAPDTQPHQAALRALAAGHDGRLRVSTLPFLAQPDFDRLLWSCDLNLVRGEDSWLRALWAGRPWLWQAYPQAGQAHHDKLAAFLARLAGWLQPMAALPGWQTAMQAWNQLPGLDVADILPWWRDPAAPALAQRLARTAAGQAGDLASRLVAFAGQARRPEHRV